MAPPLQQRRGLGEAHRVADHAEVLCAGLIRRRLRVDGTHDCRLQARALRGTWEGWLVMNWVRQRCQVALPKTVAMGVLRSLVRIGRDQQHTAQTSGRQRAQEDEPEAPSSLASAPACLHACRRARPVAAALVSRSGGRSPCRSDLHHHLGHLGFHGRLHQDAHRLLHRFLGLYFAGTVDLRETSGTLPLAAIQA